MSSGQLEEKQTALDALDERVNELVAEQPEDVRTALLQHYKGGGHCLNLGNDGPGSQ